MNKKLTSSQRRILSEMDVALRQSERKHRASKGGDVEAEVAYLRNLMRTGSREHLGRIAALGRLGYKPAAMAANVEPAQGSKYPYRITFQQALSLLLQAGPQEAYQPFLESFRDKLTEVFKAVFRFDLAQALQGTTENVSDVYAENMHQLEQGALEYIEDGMLEDYEMQEDEESVGLLHDLMYIHHLLNNRVDAPFYTPIYGVPMNELSDIGDYWFRKHLEEFVDNFGRQHLTP